MGIENIDKEGEREKTIENYFSVQYWNADRQKESESESEESNNIRL